MASTKALLIDPRDHGQRQLDLKAPVFDETAIARAEEALSELSGSFTEWLGKEIGRVQQARDAAERSGWNDDTLDMLAAAAHDLKGLGTTYGYPLASEIAASLYRLVEGEVGRALIRANASLLRAHVDALRAILREDAKSERHPLGRALADQLRTLVDQALPPEA